MCFARAILICGLFPGSFVSPSSAEPNFRARRNSETGSGMALNKHKKVSGVT